MEESQTPESSESQLPQEVVAALRERNGPEIEVPESLDAAILAHANQHLNTIGRPIPAKSKSRKWRWAAWSTGTLAAAMLLFAMMPGSLNPDRTSATVAMPEMAPLPAELTDAVAVAGDIDGSGDIDILDAFALARTLESENGNGSRWDQNGDGLLNQNDVQLVALQAVML